MAILVWSVIFHLNILTTFIGNHAFCLLINVILIFAAAGIVYIWSELA
jgi:hypothetical protein